jgi:hypothetical protein
MDDTEILKRAQAFISQHGEDAAFKCTCLEMEACACRGDRAGMERHTQVLLAMCGLLGRPGSTVH